MLKASELIEILEKKIQEYGDLEVQYLNYSMDNDETIDVLRVEKEDDYLVIKNCED